LAKAICVEPVVVSASSSVVPVTLKHLTELYRMLLNFEVQAGNEKAFLEKYGSERKWLGQFKRQPYDGGN
jgi:hypothetical protein